VIRSLVIAGGACALLASVAGAAPTRTSPLTVAPNDVVFVVNPDSNTVARLDFSGIAGALTQEAAVGTYPRTVTVAGTWVYTADEKERRHHALRPGEPRELHGQVARRRVQSVRRRRDAGR
jgi:hypothetical protein